MFITLEGIEGAGKTTAMNGLAEYLHARGDTPVLTREPGGSKLGRRIRSMLLDCRQERPDIQTELFLFLADRSQHIFELIQPALDDGQHVICDRYIDSTIAYQGYGRGLPLADLAEMNRIATCGLLPELTLLFDLPVQMGLARAGMRNQQEGTVISEGRFDSESLEFHEKVREGYLELARKYPERIRVMDATQEPDKVIASCIDCLEAYKQGQAK